MTLQTAARRGGFRGEGRCLPPRIVLLRAQMAELVDALVSGTSGGNTVGVRVPFWAVFLAECVASCLRNRSRSSSWGTASGVTPSGTESVLYTFHGSGDASTPFAGLTLLDGTLYGTPSVEEQITMARSLP